MLQSLQIIRSQSSCGGDAAGMLRTLMTFESEELVPLIINSMKVGQTRTNPSFHRILASHTVPRTLLNDAFTGLYLPDAASRVLQEGAALTLSKYVQCINIAARTNLHFDPGDSYLLNARQNFIMEAFT
ncbi:hypothetical protein LENED_009343 [Lentinula edodes]|uniref:Uncharacterized protein n=1 Tax=Lentinula edodes TaxID=5353 RepID=A0A1Q3EJF5_LENED|nr:hypothetical protein LENED_009343 [Lentinula edodes]